MRRKKKRGFGKFLIGIGIILIFIGAFLYWTHIRVIDETGRTLAIEESVNTLFTDWGIDRTNVIVDYREEMKKGRYHWIAANKEVLLPLHQSLEISRIDLIEVFKRNGMEIINTDR